MADYLRKNYPMNVFDWRTYVGQTHTCWHGHDTTRDNTPAHNKLENRSIMSVRYAYGTWCGEVFGTWCPIWMEHEQPKLNNSILYFRHGLIFHLPFDFCPWSFSAFPALTLPSKCNHSAKDALVSQVLVGEHEEIKKENRFRVWILEWDNSFSSPINNKPKEQRFP